MDKIQFKSETLPTRCEICHKSDCFDAKTNFCSRCVGIPTTIPSRYSNSTDFLDAVNDARFVKTFGIISLVGLIFFGLGKAVGIGVGIAVFFYGKNNFYKMLGAFVGVLGFLLTPLVSFWVLSAAIAVKGYDIIKVLREQGKDDPDWQITRKRALIGITTSTIGFFLSLGIIGMLLVSEVFLKSYLLQQNYDSTSYINPNSDKSPLIQATIRNDVKIVSNILIDTPAKVDARDNSGTTALIYAAQLGHIEILTLLCEAGANPNAQDLNGLSGLMYAAMYGHTKTVETLLFWGASPELKNNVGYTALDYAKQKNYNDIVEMLTPKNTQ